MYVSYTETVVMAVLFVCLFVGTRFYSAIPAGDQAGLNRAEIPPAPTSQMHG